MLGRVEIEERDGGKGCCEQICGVERGLLTSEHAGADTPMCLVELQDWDSSGDVRVADILVSDKEQAVCPSACHSQKCVLKNC